MTRTLSARELSTETNASPELIERDRDLKRGEGDIVLQIRRDAEIHAEEAATEYLQVKVTFAEALVVAANGCFGMTADDREGSVHGATARLANQAGRSILSLEFSRWSRTARRR